MGPRSFDEQIACMAEFEIKIEIEIDKLRTGMAPPQWTGRVVSLFFVFFSFRSELRAMGLRLYVHDFTLKAYTPRSLVDCRLQTDRLADLDGWMNG
jgi:hypothetical protein